MGSSSQSRKEIFDPIRRCWVRATPEEIVRQHWLMYLTGALGFPKERIAVEKSLAELPHLAGRSVPDRRIDILCYAGERPLLLIECKEGAFGEHALDQIAGYNHHVGADFLAVVSLSRVCFKPEKKPGWIDKVPTFKELIQWLQQ
ncbi:MAG: type I restriction enzyme HsdR N-terminal domain-containing protein [Verrucomicrobia bacterium]|nr:type I restriction enzyme HsdR N-terminal domain-containing protein [Verrucomicrobiota bacterium]